MSSSPSRLRAHHVFLFCLAILPAADAIAQGTVRTDWPSSRGDPQNSGSIRLIAPGVKQTNAFAFEGSGRVWGYRPGMTVWTSPVLAAHRGRVHLFAGSYDKNVYALDAATGELLWKFTTGDSISSAPVVWRSGERLWLFVTSSDRLLYALDADLGRRLWIYNVESFRPTLGGARLSSPCVGTVHDKAAVFFGHWVWDRSLSQNLQEGGVTAVDAETGVLLWRHRLGDNEITAPVFASHEGKRWLFVGSTDGSLHALDAEDGKSLWKKTELDAVFSAPAFVAVPGGARVVYASKSGIVRAVDARSGDEIWSYQTGDWVTSSPAIAVVRARHLVLVGSYDRSLYALDLLTGELVWRHHTRAGIYASPAIVDSGSKPLVLTTSWDHHLRGVSALDGTLAWEEYTGRPLWNTVGLEHSAWSSPVAAEINGRWMAYFGSYDGKLYGFRVAELAARREQSSNRSFLFSLPVMLLGVAGVALYLTRAHRRKAKTPDRTAKRSVPSRPSG